MRRWLRGLSPSSSSSSSSSSYFFVVAIISWDAEWAGGRVKIYMETNIPGNPSRSDHENKNLYRTI